jgi:hypothetical protein
MSPDLCEDPDQLRYLPALPNQIPDLPDDPDELRYLLSSLQRQIPELWKDAMARQVPLAEKDIEVHDPPELARLVATCEAIKAKLARFEPAQSIDLNSLDLGPVGSNLVRFLAERPTRSAKLLEVSKLLYKSTTKPAIKKTREQIRRTSRALSQQGSPVQVVLDRNVVSLIG